jgi:NAD+ synthase (glutamine-hydrolysing)
MKVCLGQINTTPGDFAGNLAAIRAGIERADSGGCDVVLFPELCLPGYLSQDLLYHTAYIDRNLATLEQVRHMTQACDPGLHVVVGYVERNHGRGKPFFNMAAVIAGGKILGTYAKQLIPFYDVFDELRYFEPGTELLVLEIAGKRTGIAICEDLWNDKGSDDYRYADNPMQRYREHGVDVILSLNSSPYVQGKAWQRIKVIAPGTRPNLTVVYVNQRGGQDELVFDGQSFVISNGDLVHLASAVHEDSFDMVDLSSGQSEISNVDAPMQKSKVLARGPTLRDMLVLGLRDYTQKSGFSELVVASSGGVDSAVVCQIACDAIGANHVHAVRMPSIFSTDHARDDAVALHRNLGCWDYEVEVSHQNLVDMLNLQFRRHGEAADNLVTRVLRQNRYNPVADENIQARLRDLYLMHFSNAYGAMPLSTGNKTESACGYYTHFDMNFSYAPIKDLYKFEVSRIAGESVSIPANIWKKAPSAELSPGQTDEQSLLPYAVLDPIVRAYVEDYVAAFAAFAEWVGNRQGDSEEITGDSAALFRWLAAPSAATDFQRIIGLMGRMEYKRRQTCPGTKVSKVAFGIGRRIPIVERWS